MHATQGTRAHHARHASPRKPRTDLPDHLHFDPEVLQAAASRHIDHDGPSHGLVALVDEKRLIRLATRSLQGVPRLLVLSLELDLDGGGGAEAEETLSQWQRRSSGSGGGGGERRRRRRRRRRRSRGSGRAAWSADAATEQREQQAMTDHDRPCLSLPTPRPQQGSAAARRWCRSEMSKTGLPLATFSTCGNFFSAFPYSFSCRSL